MADSEDSRLLRNRVELPLRQAPVLVLIRDSLRKQASRCEKQIVIYFHSTLFDFSVENDNISVSKR
jgi:hypothetical protein